MQLLCLLPDSELNRCVEYRTAIYYHSPEQLAIAKRVTEEVQKKYFDPKGTSADAVCNKVTLFTRCCFPISGQKIVTQLVEAGPWYDAEDYHQDYFTKNNMDIKCPTHKLHW